MSEAPWVLLVALMTGTVVLGASGLKLELVYPPTAEVLRWPLDSDQPGTEIPEGREASLTLLEANEPALNAFAPGGSLPVELPANLDPEDSFGPHTELRYLLQLKLLESRLRGIEGDEAGAMQSLRQAGHLANQLLGKVDGAIPMIHFYAGYGDFLDTAHWLLNRAIRKDEQASRPLRLALIDLLREHEGSVKAAALRSIDGELRIALRIADRMPEPLSALETYLYAFSSLGSPNDPPPDFPYSQFGMPKVSWYDKAGTQLLIKALLLPYRAALARIDGAPLPGIYQARMDEFSDRFRRRVGPMLALLEAEIGEPFTTPYLPLWLADFNRLENPLGEFLVTILALNLEMQTDSAFVREARRRILILLAAGEADSDSEPPLVPVSELEATDPFTGAPLRIDTLTRSVWSTGQDRTDNEGTAADVVHALVRAGP